MAAYVTLLATFTSGFVKVLYINETIMENCVLFDEASRFAIFNIFYPLKIYQTGSCGKTIGLPNPSSQDFIEKLKKRLPRPKCVRRFTMW